MATALHWIPDTLYNYSLAAVAANYKTFIKEKKTLHENMLFDIYYHLYKQGQLKKLAVEFSDIDIFRRLLKVHDKRCLLHNCFQAIMDYGCPIAKELALAFGSVCSSVCDLPASRKIETIQIGFSLGNFLIDAGWFSESETIFKACLSLCNSIKTDYILKIELQIYTRLLFTQNTYCKYQEARGTFHKANDCISRINDLGLKVNFASIYGEFSSYFFAMNDIKKAYSWCIDALSELESRLFLKEIIRVLCHASKACVLRREFKRSEMLIEQALHMAKTNYGPHSLVFASVLLDYGYHLLSKDYARDALKVFQTALSLHTRVFGGNNILVAKCHENLAFTSYVAGYNSGRFKDAMDHADKALNIMCSLSINDNSFLMISAKKSKALILEEMAIDTFDLKLREMYFAEALELQYYGFKHVNKEFGEMNLLTAKFFLNLGRLYQSMERYEEAQTMMLKAIAVREAILGPDDYEIALSFSQLASLYTYDMKLHQEAESLFLKSAKIGIKLFGKGYSGLEYDYKGLIRIYVILNKPDLVTKYTELFHKYRRIRSRNDNNNKTEVEFEPILPENILSAFYCIG